jgi:hypothetical protein
MGNAIMKKIKNCEARNNEVENLLTLLDAKFANDEPSAKLDAQIIKTATEYARTRRCQKRIIAFTPRHLTIAASLLLLASLTWINFNHISSTPNNGQELRTSLIRDSNLENDLIEANLQLAMVEAELLYSQEATDDGDEDNWQGMNNELQLLAAEMYMDN